jgi:major membrane immunogen (membrane-anchored lipoprotein)
LRNAHRCFMFFCMILAMISLSGLVVLVQAQKSKDSVLRPGMYAVNEARFDHCDDTGLVLSLIQDGDVTVDVRNVKVQSGKVDGTYVRIDKPARTDSGMLMKYKADSAVIVVRPGQEEGWIAAIARAAAKVMDRHRPHDVAPPY